MKLVVVGATLNGVLDLTGGPWPLSGMHRWAASIVVAAAALAEPGWAQPGFPELDVPKVLPLPRAAAPAAPSAQPSCAPQTLTRMVLRLVSPGLAAAAPAAQPRTLYRQGSTLLRSEESPDPQRGQNVVIISEPDIWMVNLATRTGQHSLDPGPEFVVHAPILPRMPDLPPAFGTLEYGCELEFLERAGAAQPRQTIPWGGEGRATLHEVVSGEHSIMILLGERSREPIMVGYAKARKPVFAVRYDDYRTNIPERPALFAPPERMLITEAAPRGAAASAAAPPAAPPLRQPPPRRPSDDARRAPR